MQIEECTCFKCGKAFARYAGEMMCAVCADPVGFANFCKTLDKEIRKRDVDRERAAKAWKNSANAKD